MKQLTLKDINDVITLLLNDGEDLGNYPIYLGRDDELNGIHTGWFINILNSDDSGSKDFIEMINDDRCNVEFKNHGILIS